MPEQKEQNVFTVDPPSHRLDVPLHDLLMKPAARSAVPILAGPPQMLPEPVFPQKPELMAAPDEDFFPKNGERQYRAEHIYRSLKGWAIPYFRSRLLPGDFHPLIAYLFNEWKCNLDCHYCWAFDNSVKGMTEDIAKRLRAGIWRGSTARSVGAMTGTVDWLCSP